MTGSPPSLTGARWVLLDPPAPVSAADLHPVVARCLAIRGFDAATGWLSPSIDHLQDPYAMDGMAEAVARLERAVHDGHRVRVITDYDVDGTTSSLILQAALGRRSATSGRPGVALTYHIPDRFTEGYGFSPLAAQRAADDGVDLIVTADIGVRDHAAVAAARAAGVDVLVCDHHLPPGADVPADALVLCPPQPRCTYPNRHLAACGVSLKLAEALLADDPLRDRLLPSLFKLAAIGTVADMVPLATLENRALVHLGLAELNRGGHAPGLAALLSVSGATPGEIDEQTLGWRIAPRINAAGRLAQATHVVELLTCRDPERAAQLAHDLDALNRARQDVQAALVDQVLRQVSDDDAPFLVVAGPEAEGFHRGVVGIAAARVKDETGRPVAVVSVQGDVAVGSVRAPAAVHAVHALDAAADLLDKYGGHPGAAGFTIRADRLDALRRRLCDHVAGLGDAPVGVAHEVDAVLRPDGLDERLFAQLGRLAPFGIGNPAVRLQVDGATLTGVRTLGKQATHLKGRLAGAPGPVDVVWWGGAEHVRALASGRVDLLGTLQENRWQGRRTLQFVVTDARAANG